MTLRMRDERYITSIISFVFTANDKERMLIKKTLNIIRLDIKFEKTEHIYFCVHNIPANALTNSVTLRFGSRLNTSCNF